MVYSNNLHKDMFQIHHSLQGSSVENMRRTKNQSELLQTWFNQFFLLEALLIVLQYKLRLLIRFRLMSIFIWKIVSFFCISNGNVLKDFLLFVRDCLQWYGGPFIWILSAMPGIQPIYVPTFLPFSKEKLCCWRKSQRKSANKQRKKEKNILMMMMLFCNCFRFIW